MKQRTILIVAAILFIALLCAIAVLLYIRNHATNTDVLPRGTSREYSLTELQSHAAITDCWISYGAQVFDISRFAANLEQTQSDEIAKLCGTNLETLPTSIKTTEKLSQYQIGILVP
jgi:hypothetical protein